MSNTKSPHERRQDALEWAIEPIALSCIIMDGEGEVERQTEINDMSHSADVKIHKDSKGVYAFINFHDSERNVETTLTVDPDAAAGLANFFRDLSSDLGKYE